MKAIIVTGGKQYTVSEGDVLYIEKLNAEAEATVNFDQVLAVVDGENTTGRHRGGALWKRLQMRGGVCEAHRGGEVELHDLRDRSRACGRGNSR